MVVIGMRMLCREGWIGLLEIDLISVSLFGRVVGDVVLLFHFFGDWVGDVGCCSCLIVISWGAFVWCVFCGQESVVILNDSWDLGDLQSLCWSKLWGDYCWVVVILDSWVGVVSWFLGLGLVVFRGDLLMIVVGAVSGLRICSGVNTLGVCSLCSCWLVFWGWLVGSRWRFVF